MVFYYAIAILSFFKIIYFLIKKPLETQSYKYIIGLLMDSGIIAFLLFVFPWYLYEIWNQYLRFIMFLLVITTILLLKRLLLYWKNKFKPFLKIVIMEIILIILSIFLWSLINSLIHACDLCLPENITVDWK